MNAGPLSLARDVARLFGDVPVRHEYYGWRLWGGFRGEFPITNCLSATPLSVGAFATKVNTRKRARNAVVVRFLEDGWARPKKLLEGQNGWKGAAGCSRCTATALFFALTQFSNVGSQLRPARRSLIHRRNQLGLVKCLDLSESKHMEMEQAEWVWDPPVRPPLQVLVEGIFHFPDNGGERPSQVK